MTSVPPPNVYLPIPSFAPGVRDAIYAHVYRDPANELGGLLVGDRRPHGDIVVGAIPAHGARGDVTSLTFTQASWASMLKELDARYPGAAILGWYHSHPGHGIFLSRHDRFIHDHFFSAPWQLAIVVDPQQHEEGLFMWRAEGLVQVAEAHVDPAWSPLPGEKAHPDARAAVTQPEPEPPEIEPEPEPDRAEEPDAAPAPATGPDPDIWETYAAARRATYRQARRAAERRAAVRRRRLWAVTALIVAVGLTLAAIRLASG